jgi:glycosyltransferase involved in cell wall biosynthesis
LRVAVNLEQLLSPSPGGVGRYSAKLVASLARLGVEVQPVVARHTPAQLRAAWCEFGLEGLDRTGHRPGRDASPLVLPLPRPVLYDAWNLVGWPPRRWPSDVDLVHAPSLAVPPKQGKPLVVSIHDAAPWIFPDAFTARGRWFHTMGSRAASRRADLVITGTAAAAAELATYMALPPERVRVVPYGVDLPPWRPRSDETGPDETGADETGAVLSRFRLAGVPYVLWVGSLEPRKGVGTLVTAMAQLARRLVRASSPAPALVLAGYPGWQNSSLLPAADVARLGQSFRQIGRVTEAELWALYAGAAVFAFPSRHEGFGLPVLEAMAAGVPVVASDIAPLREVSGDAAVLVPPGDAGAWAEAIEALLADGPRRAQMAAQGRRRAELFSWASTAAATLAVYRELVP